MLIAQSPEPLDAQDHEQVHAAIARIGSCTSLDEFAVAACRELLELIPGLSTSYNEANPTLGRIVAQVWPDPGMDWYIAYGELVGRLAHTHPYASYVAMTDEGAPRTWGDVDSDGLFAQSELYREFYVPNGIHSQLLFALPSPPDVNIVMAINRDGGDFDAREQHIAEIFRVHLVNLYRLVANSDHRVAEFEALKSDGWTSVVVTDAGGVIATTPEAERIGASLNVDLRTGSSIARTTLWEKARLDEAGEPWSVTRRSDLIRVESDEGAFDVMLLATPVGPHVLLLRSPHDVTIERAQSLGLTVRQAEIACLVLDGATNDQIARKLGISASTVRKHLQAIFETLGVSSRAMVAVTLMRHTP